MHFSFVYTPLAGIDGQDSTFALAPPGLDPRLQAAVARTGLLQPLWLQPQPGRPFRLVSGFGRFQAAVAAGLAEVPALLLPADWDDLACYRWRLTQKSALGPLLPLQCSHAIATLGSRFGCSREEIIHSWLAVMGQAANPRIYDLAAPLVALEPELQAAIARDELSVEIAGAMAAAPAADRLAFWQLAATLRLGKNRQRDFWPLCHDVARIRRIAMAALLQEDDLVALRNDPLLTPSQKSERIKERLMQWRYPDYVAAQQRFEAILGAARVPPGMHLRPSPWFSGEEYTLDFTFRSTAEFADRLQVLERMRDQGLVDRLVQLT